MQTSPDEKDGGYGVAIVKAYISGEDPDRHALVSHLDAPWHALENAFKRLQTNGIFSERSWVRTDSLLAESGKSVESQRMWSFIAALSSGFLGKGVSRQQS